MSLKRRGQCLCGAVEFTGDISSEVQACHCRQCQRWTGGGPLYAVRVRNLDLTGETEITAYTHSDHGERASCRTCGSTLYWRLQGRAVSFVSPGLLDDQRGLTVTEEIFVDGRPDWIAPVEGAAQRTEAEMKAQLQEFLEKNA